MHVKWEKKNLRKKSRTRCSFLFVPFFPRLLLRPLLDLAEIFWSHTLADQGASHAKDSYKRNQSPIQREIPWEKPNSAHIKLYVTPRG